MDIMFVTLKKDICGVRKVNSHVSDSTYSTKEQMFPPEAQYACVYWVQHLTRGKYEASDEARIYEFFRKHTTHWIEAMCIVGKIPDAILTIYSLLGHISNKTVSQNQISRYLLIAYLYA